MKIEIANIDHADALSEVLLAASAELRYLDFTEEGWTRFIHSNTPESFRAKLSSPEYKYVICKELNQVIGFMSLKGNEKIEQLFVLPEFRRRGISSALWNQAKKLAIESGSTGNFWVRSSSPAVPVYKKFGFITEGEPQNFGGIHFQLMKLKP